MNNPTKQEILEDRVAATSIGIGSLLSGVNLFGGGTYAIIEALSKSNNCEQLAAVPVGILIYGGTAMLAYNAKESYIEVKNLSKQLESL